VSNNANHPGGFSNLLDLRLLQFALPDFCHSFSNLTLLVERYKGHLACKKSWTSYPWKSSTSSPQMVFSGRLSGDLA